jgi:ketol-acid reductoisomerase
MTPEDAFKNSCESITGPITKTISKQGIYKVASDYLDLGCTQILHRFLQVYEMMNAADKAKFEQAYSAAYTPAKDVLAEIYDEVRRFFFYPCFDCFQSPEWDGTAATRSAL